MRILIITLLYEELFHSIGTYVVTGGMNIPTEGETQFSSTWSQFYDVCLCADETSLVVSEGDIFGGDACAGTDTLGTDAVYGTTLGYFAV